MRPLIRTEGTLNPGHLLTTGMEFCIIAQDLRYPVNRYRELRMGVPLVVSSSGTGSPATPGDVLMGVNGSYNRPAFKFTNTNQYLGANVNIPRMLSGVRATFAFAASVADPNISTGSVAHLHPCIGTVGLSPFEGTVYAVLFNMYDNAGASAVYGYRSVTDTRPHLYVYTYIGTGSGNSGRLQLYVDGVPVTLTYSGTVPAAMSNTNYGSYLGMTFKGTTATPDQCWDFTAAWSRYFRPSDVASLYYEWANSFPNLLRRTRLRNGVSYGVGSGTDVSTSVPVAGLTASSPTTSVSTGVGVVSAQAGLVLSSPTLGVNTGVNVASDLGYLILSAPTVTTSTGLLIPAELANVVVSAPTVDISAGAGIDSTIGDLSLSGVVPIVTAGTDAVVSPSSGDLIISSPDVAFSGGVRIETGGSFILSAPPLSFSGDAVSVIPQSTVVVSTPTATFSGDAVVEVVLQPILLTGYAEINVGVVVEALAKTLSLSSPTSSIDTSVNIATEIGFIALSGPSVGVSTGVTIASECGIVALLVNDPSLSMGAGVSPDVSGIQVTSADVAVSTGVGVVSGTATITLETASIAPGVATSVSIPLEGPATLLLVFPTPEILTPLRNDGDVWHMQDGSIIRIWRVDNVDIYRTYHTQDGSIKRVWHQQEIYLYRVFRPSSLDLES